MKISSNYLALSQFYENCLDQHGTTPKGVDWPNQADLTKRFQTMLELIKPTQQPIHLLDLGCGYGALVSHLNENTSYSAIHYEGVDISQKMIDAAKSLHPSYQFTCRDILKEPYPANSMDYIIMNGLLTEKRALSWDEMVTFAKQIILAAFQMARCGIAFNVMSYHVDWCHPHLFYWAFDELAAFLRTHCSKHFVFRQDYGLYEYTVYVYRESN